MGSLRVVIKDGLLSKEAHRVLICIIGYIAWRYGIAPSGADLEGAVFDDVEKEVYEDVVHMLNRRYGKFKYGDLLEVTYE